MLGDEDRVPAHRRLSAVVFRLGRRESLADELPPVIQNDRQRLFGQMARSFGPKRKRLRNRLSASAEKRSSESRIGSPYPIAIRYGASSIFLHDSISSGDMLLKSALSV